ncbi:hypothetical protein NT239_01885 [Chitinibacter sp. SCUT-21]|uniref:hypothetical protein n=1 Tax=Chitinibacter sp. SCUT-21 TaxID=2970891 RepID=UPI0035A679EC
MDFFLANIIECGVVFDRIQSVRRPQRALLTELTPLPKPAIPVIDYLIGENAIVMKQIANNTPEQAMLGDFAKAIDNAIMDSSAAHQNQMLQLLSDPSKANKFARVVFDLLAMGKN